MVNTHIILLLEQDVTSMYDVKTEIAKFADYACKNDNFIHHCGIELEKVGDGSLTLSMEITDNLVNGYFIAHGGALASLIDTCIGLTCFAYGKKVVTIDMTINYIKGVPITKTAHATSNILHIGKQTIIGEALVTNENGEIYAKGTGSFFVVGENNHLKAHW